MVLELKSPCVEDKILEVFEEDEILYYPIRTQKQARNFVKALNSKGVKYDMICEEIGEHAPNFESWRKSLGRQGIGQRVITWINHPLNEILESDEEEEEFVENLRQKIRKRSENGTAPKSDVEADLQRRREEEKEKQRKEKEEREKREKEQQEKEERERQEKLEREMKEAVELERKEKEERLAKQRQIEEERLQQQRYEEERRREREREKKRLDEEQAELERKIQEAEQEENEEDVEEIVLEEKNDDEKEKEEEEEEEQDSEIIFQPRSSRLRTPSPDDKRTSVHERLQAFEAKMDTPPYIPHHNHNDSKIDSPPKVMSPTRVSPEIKRKEALSAQLSNISNGSYDNIDVDENYNSDLDPDNTDQSPVLSTLVKKISAMRTGHKNGAGYIYVFSDGEKTSENRQIKVGVSRCPDKRLKQAQLFNPYLWSAVQFAVSQRQTALSETLEALAEYQLDENYKGWFSGTYADMEAIVAEVAAKYPTCMLETVDNSEESQC